MSFNSRCVPVVFVNIKNRDFIFYIKKKKF